MIHIIILLSSNQLVFMLMINIICFASFRFFSDKFGFFCLGLVIDNELFAKFLFIMVYLIF